MLAEIRPTTLTVTTAGFPLTPPQEEHLAVTLKVPLNHPPSLIYHNVMEISSHVFRLSSH